MIGVIIAFSILGLGLIFFTMDSIYGCIPVKKMDYGCDDNF